MLLSSSQRTIVRFSVLLSLLILALMAAAPACGGGDDTTSGSSSGPTKCLGVDVDGVCEEKCDPAKCLHADPMGDDPGFTNTCVNNRCQLECTSQKDCDNYGDVGPYLANTQDCLAAVEDGTAAPISICTTNGKPRGVGVKCPHGQYECASDSYQFLQQACPKGEPCGPSQCPDANPACAGITDWKAREDAGCSTCKIDEVACRGKDGCSLARCTGDLSPCSLEEACPAEECKDLQCLSKGEGDADAYCTIFDCAEDTDCPGGYWCGVIRDPREICGSSPKKGNSPLCGQTTEPCLDLATKPAGTTFFEGPTCLLRRACMKRTQCAPCETDAQCTEIGSQKCALTPDGQHACALMCNEDSNCAADSLCDLSQPTSDSTGQIAAGACIPRFGACKGTGQFCEPCRNDTDCGDTGTCYGASLSGELACINIPLDTTCTTDSNCPKSPSGKYGDCSSDSGSSLYHTCFFPFNAGAGKYACW